MKANTHENAYPRSRSSATPPSTSGTPVEKRKPTAKSHGDHHGELEEVGDDIGEGSPGEHRRARHRQRAETVDQPLLQILGEPEGRDETAEGDRLHDDPRHQEVDVVEARRLDGPPTT